MRIHDSSSARHAPVRLAILVALVASLPALAQAQGLMSGTGMQPSKQLATPPGAPAIDQPGAEQRSRARHRAMKSARRTHASPSTADSTSSQPTVAPHG